MKKVSAALLVFAAIVLSSCRNDNDKPELIDRLRGLGAFTTPLVTTPSNTTPQKVTITAYAAVMNGDTVTVTPYVDAKPSSTYATPETDITIDPNNMSYTALDGFRLLKFTATAVVPTEALLAPLTRGGVFTGSAVRYGFSIAGTARTERITGTYLVYPAGSTQLTWQSPGIAVTAPAAGASLAVATATDLVATLTNPNNESLKLGWFVSEGTVGNRRKVDTLWTPDSAGTRTVLAALYGKQSHGFAIQVIQVVVQ